MKINGNAVRPGYIIEHAGRLWRAVRIAMRRHCLLDQGMGADGERGATGGNRLGHRHLLLLFQAAGEPGDFQPERGQPL